MRQNKQRIKREKVGLKKRDSGLYAFGIPRFSRTSKESWR
jgi:hypothetical protein